jgi:hypothetical protein
MEAQVPDLFRKDDSGRQPQDPPTLARVFRVTRCDSDQYTQLVLAADRIEASEGKGQVISNLDRRAIHEVIECTELLDEPKASA